MQITTTPLQDAKAVVKAEFAAMLDRCDAAGLVRSDAHRTIAGILMMESLTSWCQAERDTTAAAAQSPAGLALQKAFELHQSNEELRRLGIKPDDSPFKTACMDYLLLAHGAAPGDLLEIYGWAKPRTIRLKAFHLSFSHADQATDAFMWFEGDGIRNCRPDRTSDHHGCPLDTPVHKVRF